MGVDHYENFPVASMLCPSALRPAVTAIYWFARTADDIADEGSASPEARLAELAEYRTQLDRTLSSGDAGVRWPRVFGPLAREQARHRLPPGLLHDLLDAFEQDARNPVYADRQALLDYCRHSANPIGRLLLHLYGVNGERERWQSDAICTALQLINFWQDLSIDQFRGRSYLPLEDLSRYGLPAAFVQSPADSPALRRLVADLCAWSATLMHQGAPLATSLPGRIGWELRLVVQGGLRILERIALLDHGTLCKRPELTWRDGPAVLWRALHMRPRQSA